MPLPPHVLVPLQVPHSSVPPQPSAIVPQLAPASAQVVGVQTPHSFGMPPPPHVSGVEQVPHWSV
jgi:hypothetical protein